MRKSSQHHTKKRVDAGDVQHKNSMKLVSVSSSKIKLMMEIAQQSEDSPVIYLDSSTALS